MFAGSILFLEDDTSYEIMLTASDPDGFPSSESQVVIVVTTRAIPSISQGGDIFHVIPGSGGGNGSEIDPFRGIVEADLAASPGDVFLLHQGSYGDGVEFLKGGMAGSYVVWKAVGDGAAVFGDSRISASHVWIEGLEFTGMGGDGLRTSDGTEDVVIKNNSFTGWHYSIRLKGTSKNWYIVDNTIVGDNDPDVSEFGGEGIELQQSDGHIVAYNRISRVADGISYARSNCDIYGNDIFDTSDDGIEPDYGFVNIRMWGNRITKVLSAGFSFQPMNGAPWYIVRNQVVASGEVLKLRDTLGSTLLAHNTIVGRGSRVMSGSGVIELRNMQSNNNLWITANPATNNYIWETSSLGELNWRTNLDYDGFDWWNANPAFKWEGQRYPDLASFSAATGLEQHGIVIQKNTTFSTFDVPQNGAIPFQFMTLQSGSNAIDAGIILPNINDNFLGNAPDLGAYEYGAPLPQYGPCETCNHPIDDLSSVSDSSFTIPSLLFLISMTFS